VLYFPFSEATPTSEKTVRSTFDISCCRLLKVTQVKGKADPAVAVFDQGADGWTGVTGFVDDSEQYLEALRLGILLYRRTE
jgi:hypothetical protein